MAETFLQLCLERDLKVIIMGLWPQGPQQANLAIDKAMEDPAVKAKNLKYGTDYVNLGFQTGNEFVIQRMGTSFKSMFPTDYKGTPYDELPLVKNIKNFSNIPDIRDVMKLITLLENLGVKIQKNGKY